MATTPKTPEARTVELRVRVRPSEAVKLQALAERDDLPLSAIVRAAIRQYTEEGK